MSQRRKTLQRGAWALALCLSFGAGAASGQEDAEAAQRAQELIERIRNSMREIDKILLGAADPVRAAEEAEQAARDLEELLDEAESKSRSVMASLDELIEMAKPPQQSSQSQQQQQQDPQQQPQNSGNQRQRSEDPQQLQQQGDPEQQDQQQQDQQSQPDADPRGQNPDNSDPNQRDANRPPPDSPTGEFERDDTSGRWGLLPPKEAELLLRHNIEEFPLRYRHWMDLYYKRVNSAGDR